MENTPKIHEGGIFLVYENENGERFFQSIFDLNEAGTLIDPETGDDMYVIGWSETDE